MKKLLIATASLPLTQALIEQVNDVFHISVCSTGTQALNIMCQWKPDLALIDLNLTELDGIEVLKIANSVGASPKTVAISYYISDYVVSSLEQLNVCSLIQLPCNVSQLASRLLDVAQWGTEKKTTSASIKSILAVLGFKLGSGGCYVATECIQAYLQNPGQHFTTQLYPYVAQQCQTTPAQVEKSLRDAIRSAWKRCDGQIWNMYFTPSKNGASSRPTNAMFITRIAHCIQQAEDNQKIKRAE